jgi:hypothetical protein
VWLQHTARVGAVMKAKRVWPWWVYTRMVELAAAPTTVSQQERMGECAATKDKRGAG